jgi:hypothetical protein
MEHRIFALGSSVRLSPVGSEPATAFAGKGRSKCWLGSGPGVSARARPEWGVLAAGPRVTSEPDQTEGKRVQKDEQHRSTTTCKRES